MTFTALPPVGRSRAASGGLLVDPGAWLMRGVMEPFLSAIILARRDSAGGTPTMPPFRAPTLAG
jgi:hypothetical protein